MIPRLTLPLTSCIATTAFFLFSGCATSSPPAPAQASISSKPWIAFQPMASVEEIQRLQPEDQVSMACAKCKSVVVATKSQLTTKPGHGMAEELMTVDQCPGCGGKMVVSADKQTHLVHTCSKCGEDSAFCCAMAKGREIYERHANEVTRPWQETWKGHCAPFILCFKDLRFISAARFESPERAVMD